MNSIEKLLRRVPPKHKVQIFEAVHCLLDKECRSRLKIEKLSGSSLFKIHTGRYRIIFSMDEDGIQIKDVRLRNESTYRDI